MLVLWVGERAPLPTRTRCGGSVELGLRLRRPPDGQPEGPISPNVLGKLRRPRPLLLTAGGGGPRGATEAAAERGTGYGCGRSSPHDVEAWLGGSAAEATARGGGGGGMGVAIA